MVLGSIISVAAFCLCFSVLFFWKKWNMNTSQKDEDVVIKDLGRPRLPSLIRSFNFLASYFPMQPLTVDIIISEAQKKTGLKQFLDEETYPFRDGLAKLVQDYNDHKNRLTRFGRLCLRRVFVRMVANNLRIAERIRKHPEIVSETIMNPVFIIGPPRTGSSHLHDTLSQHPTFRTPKHLELLHPILEEAHLTSSDVVDPREPFCHFYLNFARYLRPYLPLLHAMGPNVSEEDIFITGIVFRSIIFGLMFPCKEYMQWFGEIDHTTVYDFLKLSLQVIVLFCIFRRLWMQLLQWQDIQKGGIRKRWLLKSPDHSFSLPGLIKVFPDATIIQTHREMNAVLPSYLNLVVYIHGIFNEVIDLNWTGEWWTAWFEFVLHRFINDQKNMKGKTYPQKKSNQRFS